MAEARDPDLEALEKDFDAGNYRAVRERTARIEASDQPLTNKLAARAIRARTEPSRAQIALLVIAGAFIVALSGYEIVEHGKNSSSPVTAPRSTVEHIH